MGAASSDFVDPETLPLQILLQSGRDKKDKDEENDDEEPAPFLRENWQLTHEKNMWRDYALKLHGARDDQSQFDIAFNQPV